MCSAGSNIGMFAMAAAEIVGQEVRQHETYGDDQVDVIRLQHLMRRVPGIPIRELSVLRRAWSYL